MRNTSGFYEVFFTITGISGEMMLLMSPRLFSFLVVLQRYLKNFLLFVAGIFDNLQSKRFSPGYAKKESSGHQQPGYNASSVATQRSSSENGFFTYPLDPVFSHISKMFFSMWGQVKKRTVCL
jgi:hypothetical protein